jgi:predicted nucleotide-binding protein (sugar kinase/HSP70/actin superfamily)
MDAIKKIVVALFIATIILALLAFWYKWQFSMEDAKAFEVNDKKLSTKVLIATQGSTFKDSVLTLVIDSLAQMPIYIKVIDVKDLKKINENEWTAIAIMHTWENWRSQPDAAQFIKEAGNLEKLVVVSTSGGGDMMIEGIDGISAASQKGQPRPTANYVIKRVTAIIKNEKKM